MPLWTGKQAAWFGYPLDLFPDFFGHPFGRLLSRAEDGILVLFHRRGGAKRAVVIQLGRVLKCLSSRGPQRGPW
jgi:hypothetical protein